jgi:histidine phosphotransferase ChpT
MTSALIDEDKNKLIWKKPQVPLQHKRKKLLLNFIIIPVQTIPRGGTLTVESVGEAESMGFRIAASGLNARIPLAVPALLAGTSETGSVDAHAIQPFYAGLLARSCGLKVDLRADGEAIVVEAR